MENILQSLVVSPSYLNLLNLLHIMLCVLSVNFVHGDTISLCFVYAFVDTHFKSTFVGNPETSL